MRRTRLAAVLAVVALATVALPAADPPGKFALLVGVNDYDHDGLRNLKYAANDATDLRDVLAAGGGTARPPPHPPAQGEDGAGPPAPQPARAAPPEPAGRGAP